MNAMSDSLIINMFNCEWRCNRDRRWRHRMICEIGKYVVRGSLKLMEATWSTLVQLFSCPSHYKPYLVHVSGISCFVLWPTFSVGVM